MKKLLPTALALCLFLLIVGAKWAVFDRFGSPMPDWDQWDAEAVNLYIPWFEHDHFAQHLFQPHNEHRVVLTKLQNLALVLLNGQWDSRLEAVTNALLHAALAVAFWVLACRWIERRGLATVGTPSPPVATETDNASERRRGLALVEPSPLLRTFLFVLTAALFGLPLAWQNILGGFHSQQYWLLGLSFAAIVTLPFARPGSLRWWIGTLGGTLALGSMGSGFLAAVVVLGLIGWRMWRGEAGWRETWPTIGLSVALIAVGVATRVEVYYHQQLKARTAHDFVFSILRSLEWPLRDHDWTGIILWLPWVLVAWRVLRPRAEDDARAPQTIAALGGWVLVQIVATAYARGAGADYPASRYMDTLAFGAMVNVAALAWLLSSPDLNRLRRLGPAVLTAAWLILLGLGLRDVLERNLQHELPDAKKYYNQAEGHMRRYLATNDPKHLASPDIPFPSAEGLVERLAHASLRALMPLPIRAPVAFVPAPDKPGFVENDARGADPEHPPRVGLSPRTAPLDATKSWGSFGADGAASTGAWQSAPLAPTSFDWLKFETAGQPGEPGVALELRSARTGAILASVQPSRTPGDTWRAAYVRMPHEPFVVTATDRSSGQWLAFSPPVEMGTLSHWAWQATKQGMLLLWLSAGATVLLLAAVVLPAFSWPLSSPPDDETTKHTKD